MSIEVSREPPIESALRSSWISGFRLLSTSDRTQITVTGGPHCTLRLRRPRELSLSAADLQSSS